MGIILSCFRTTNYEKNNELDSYYEVEKLLEYYSAHNSQEHMKINLLDNSFRK